MENDTTNGLIRSVDFRDKRYRLETGSGGNEIFYFQWPTVFALRRLHDALLTSAIRALCSLNGNLRADHFPLPRDLVHTINVIIIFLAV